MLHSGIDLHKNDLVISTVDGSGIEVERKRLRTQRPLVARYFASLQQPAGVALAQSEETLLCLRMHSIRGDD